MPDERDEVVLFGRVEYLPRFDRFILNGRWIEPVRASRIADSLERALAYRASLKAAPVVERVEP